MLIFNSGVMAEVSLVLDELVYKDEDEDELVWEEEDKEKFPILKLRKIWDSHSGRVKNTILWTTFGSCRSASELLRKLQSMFNLWFWLLLLLSCSFLEHQ